jgi:hypothetical protein
MMHLRTIAATAVLVPGYAFGLRHPLPAMGQRRSAGFISGQALALTGYRTHLINPVGLQELKDVSDDPFVAELRGKVLELIDPDNDPDRASEPWMISTEGSGG